MIRNNFTKIAFLSPLTWMNNDKVSKDIKTVKEADLSVFEKETGWERVCQLFRKDDFGRISSELHSIIQISCFSTVFGIFYGGIVYSREAYIDFMKNNQATAFTSHFDAKKKLQDAITLSFAKGAFKWSWRLTLFSSTYITVSTCAAAYRGKNGIIEHCIGGAAAGFVYRFKLGPRAWVVGTTIGLVLGTFTGVITYSLLNLTGMTMQDVRYWNYKWLEKRTDSFNKAHKEHIEKEQSILFRERERKLGNTGAKLDFIPDKTD
ncbi:hypothetical protein RN001_011520 [Aquatica leii]|uniref:Complex I assembly factor TIMMDC1, mitochondrial n=1 Tax=Aquatica leii TaxID=1421715 RepID=A0AAN7SM20_9COLE|nr:hypothetical protein RN001_011520 [Aquatica leii]